MLSYVTWFAVGQVTAVNIASCVKKTCRFQGCMLSTSYRESTAEIPRFPMLSNLALVCIHCNLHKGPNLSGIDPESGVLTRLFHPREDTWHDHFQIAGPRIEGRTDIRRTTVVVLHMNSGNRLQLRAKLLKQGIQ